MSQARKNVGTPSASRTRRPSGVTGGKIRPIDTMLSLPRAGRGVIEVFRSQAEQIRHFHEATPERFRTPRNYSGQSECLNISDKRNGVRGEASEGWNRIEGCSQGLAKAQRKLVSSSTKPQPFQLEGSKRVERRLSAWQQEVTKEKEVAQRAMMFHACPATVLETPPFAPKLSSRPLTVPVSGPSLSTGKRAGERDQFEAGRRAREEQEKLSRAGEEARRTRELRKKMVHRARPVPKYREMEVKPSNKAVTVAVSPKLTFRNSTEKER